MNVSMEFPEIGSWFRGGDGNTFEVVAVDHKDQTIELQHFDGTLEELDLDAWRELQAEPVTAPEDWSGSMDVDESDLPENSETRREFDDPMNFVDEYDDES